MPSPQPEPVRLVIWDLDETFWGGTLTEGGIHYSRAAHDAVITLARRGIVSAICSKNDIDAVRPILEREGIWEYFVFPSVSWDSKGPRLAAMVDQVQLRAPTILFIDDNPQNLAEARHFVPGIQTEDEHFIAAMLDDPRLRGKDDPGLTRLAQYRLLQQRQSEQAAHGGDTAAFLRGSGLTVTIEHDLAPHIDRAIELINRTNQLNYTKQRLPEDIDEARAALRKMVGGYLVQAGIIRVRDRYGDYGYCGFYAMRTGGGWSKLDQFCFSCRILGMGVETWLYQRLGRPQLVVRGEVLTNVFRRRVIDWIEVAAPSAEVAEAAPKLDYFYARGGCDLLAVSHYFTLQVRDVFGEFNTTRGGANLRLDHSMFARLGLEGIAEPARRALALFGHRDEDFKSVIPELPASGRAVWLLSFWADADNAMYRHRATGVAVPLALAGVATDVRDLIALPDETSGADPAFLAALRADFDYVGCIGEEDFKHNARLVLGRAPAGARVYVLMANEYVVRPNGAVAPARHKVRLNGWVSEVAAAFANVTLLPVRDFIRDEAEVQTLNHFDRMVYFRIFEHIQTQLAATDAAARHAVPA